MSVFNSIEKLKAKDVVDIFQTTRALRLQRCAMVQTMVRTFVVVAVVAAVVILLFSLALLSAFFIIALQSGSKNNG